MALPIGRGMFTLASAPPLLTEALRLAPLTLKGTLTLTLPLPLTLPLTLTLTLPLPLPLPLALAPSRRTCGILASS